MSVLDDKIESLRAKVESNVGVGQSAIAYIQGVPGLIEEAKQEALAAGATETQLASLTELETKLEEETQAFTDALNANPGPTDPNDPNNPNPSGRRR